MTKTEGATGMILFVCPHGAAKSVLAAAEFERAARERALPFHAACAGTDPDDHHAPAVVAALLRDGVDVSMQRPRPVSREDIARAHRVISLGCDRVALGSDAGRITRWDMIPPVSDGLNRAREVIRAQVAELVTELAREESRTPRPAKAENRRRG